MKNLIGGFRTDNSELVKVYNNIYTYNISNMVFSYKKESNLNSHSYSLKDVIQYKYYTIDNIINTYDDLVKINYIKKLMIIFLFTKKEIIQKVFLDILYWYVITDTLSEQ